MPFTSTGIFFRRLPGGPTLEASKDSRAGAEILMMPWASIDQFIEDSFPLPQAVGGFLLRPPCRRMPGRRYLEVDKITASPFYGDLPGDDPYMPLDVYTEAASWAAVTVSYKSSETEDNDEDNNDDGGGGGGGDEQNPEAFLTQRMSIGGEYLTVPIKAITWATKDGYPREPVSSELPADFDSLSPTAQQAALKEFKEKFQTTTETLVTKIIPLIEHQLTWKSVINPPFDVIRATVGKINSDPLFGAAPETLLFMGAEAQREFTNGRFKPWTLDYRFSERSINEDNQVYGWNHFLKPDTGKWEKVQLGGKDVYQTTGMKVLFQPGMVP